MSNSKGIVLLVAKSYPPVVGGVETYSESVARGYLRRNLIPIVLTQTAGDSGWRCISYPEGVIRLFNTGPGKQSWVFARLLFEAASVFRRERFTFVHATTWRPALAICVFARKLPLVLTVHGREVMNYPWFLKHPMIGLLRRADVLAAVSSATMEIAKTALHRRRPRGKWIVAFNGISYPDEARSFFRENSLPNASINLLSLARLVPRKNVQACIQAIMELRDEGVTGFRYAIAGRGPMEMELKATVRKNGLEDIVHFLGYVADRDLPSLYQAADVFLHPQTNVGEGNDFEGFGLVIADAMSFGCAVLAGDAGGPRDFVTHNTTGILADGMSSSEVKEAIRRLVTDTQLRRRLSSNGRAYALSELSWDRHVEKIVQSLPGTSRLPNRPQ